MNFKHIKYTWEHKKAFLEVEKQLLGGNTLRGYLHDVDKLIMYVFLSKKIATKIHRKFSRHHERAKTIRDFEQVMIDWECARLTKKDKQLNAYEFLYLHSQELIDKMLPLLIKYKIAQTNDGKVFHKTN